jgi:5-methylcytosine-specific restriction endonuclease McrA
MWVWAWRAQRVVVWCGACAGGSTTFLKTFFSKVLFQKKKKIKSAMNAPKRTRSGVGAARKKIPLGVRMQLAASQHWQCNVCGQLLPAAFQVDHIVALENNGSNRLHNLQALCPNCHAEKTYKDNFPHVLEKYGTKQKQGECLIL